MGGKRFRIGSIAVLFSVVVLCVAIFSILTVVTALSDQRMADRYAQQVEKNYQCLNLGEQWLSQADAYFQGKGSLPENTREENGVLSAEIIIENTRLQVQACSSADGIQVLRWDLSSQWQPDQSWTLLGSA